MSSESPEVYANIRDLLGRFIGKKLLDVTQHDAEEWARQRKAYILLMFEDGSCIQFWQGDDGFTSYGPGEYEGPEVEEEPN